MEPPQIVLDTNVLVAGLRSPAGPSFRLLSLIGRNRFDINLSVPLVFEYEEVLLRQQHELGLDRDDIVEVVRFLCKVGRKWEISYLWRPFLRDPDDDMLLELAVASSAEAIVTFNRADFRGVESFGLGVLTPGRFLRDLGETP